MDGEFPVMKDIKLGDMVAIELPAHIWVGFISSYAASAAYNCGHATTIAAAAQEALLNPAFLKGKQAESQQQMDMYQRAISGIIPGFPAPEVPPDTSGL